MRKKRGEKLESVAGGMQVVYLCKINVRTVFDLISKHMNDVHPLLSSMGVSDVKSVSLSWVFAQSILRRRSTSAQIA